jgi:uncharacterized protein (DUF885 family)
MTEVFRLCDDYITRWAALDPVAAGMVGLSESFGAATDYGPDGYAAREELVASTLAALGVAAVTSEADRLAASFLRERLEAQLAWHRAGEPLRLLRTPIGQLSAIRDSVDLLPRDGDESWRNIASRLAAFPAIFASWRSSLDAGLDRGLTAARRQAVEAAAAADRYAGTHDALVASYGDGPLAGELAAAAAQAHGSYREMARYLREDYAPRAAERDAVGAERYAVAARMSLGADIDLAEAYEWGWAELARIEAELAIEAGKISPGASLDEAASVLDQTEYVTGADAYLAWLQDRHDEAVERLDGVLFDIAPPLRRIEAVLARGSSSGAAYYTKPSEDLARPGRTWWPLGGRGDADRFQTWSELSTVFHEGVPGHHLQAGAAMMAGDGLSRYAKSMFVSGHGEGWALYAERLVRRAGHAARHAERIGAARGPGGHRHRRPPGPAAARRLPVDVRASLRGAARARPGRAAPGARRDSPLLRLARPGDLLQAGRARLAGGPRAGHAAPGLRRVRPEAVAHRRAQPGPARAERPHRDAGQGRRRRRLKRAIPSSLVLADPVRTPEEAAQSVMQAGPGVGQCVHPVHRRPVGRRQQAGLGVVHGGPDMAPGDLAHLVCVDETQAAIGGDHDPVEDVDLRYLQHVLEGTDRGTATAQHRRPADRRLIRDRQIVIAHRSNLAL